MKNKLLISEVDRINSLMGNNKKVFIKEGPLIRNYSTKVFTSFSNQVDNLVKLRQIGEINTNKELKQNLLKQIDILGDSIDDSTKNILKNIADEIGRSTKSTFDDAVKKFKNEIDPKKIKLDLEKTNIIYSNIIKSLEQTTETLINTKNNYKVKLENIYFKKLDEQINNNSESIIKDYKNVDEVVNTVKIQLYEFLKKSVPGQEKEFYDFFIDYISNKLKNYQPLREIFDLADEVTVQNTSGKQLPKVTNTKYQEILKKFEDNGYQSLTKEETIIMDLVDKFIKSTDTNYLKLIKEINKKMKITLKDYFKNNKTIKNRFGNFVRKVLYSKGEVNVWKVNDLGITEEIKTFLNNIDKNFLTNVESGKYRYLKNEKGDWDQLNMLDTNNIDGPNYLEDLIRRKKGIQNVDEMTEDEIESFLSELNNYSDESLREELEYVKNNRNEFIKASAKTTEKGDFSELYFLNHITTLNKLSDFFDVVYHAGALKGNPIDTILGIDVIMRSKQTGELFSVQIKTTKNISIKPSTVYPGQESFNVWLSSGIKLKGEKDLAVVIDDNSNFIVFSGQMQFIKNAETGEWVEKAKGFKSSGGVHYIDINSDGIKDIITNIKIN